jgi:hypothetical protein
LYPFLFLVPNPKIVNMMNFGFLDIVRSINVASFKMITNCKFKEK